MLNNQLLGLAGLTIEEKTTLDEILSTLSTEEKRNQFMLFYTSNRRDPMLVLLCTCIGFFGVAGVQRILVGQVLMGIIFFFTAGLCLIGTIYDIINYKSLASEYNIAKAREGFQMVK